MSIFFAEKCSGSGSAYPEDVESAQSDIKDVDLTGNWWKGRYPVGQCFTPVITYDYDGNNVNVDLILSPYAGKSVEGVPK